MYGSGSSAVICSQELIEPAKWVREHVTAINGTLKTTFGNTNINAAVHLLYDQYSA